MKFRNLIAAAASAAMLAGAGTSALADDAVFKLNSNAAGKTGTVIEAVYTGNKLYEVNILGKQTFTANDTVYTVENARSSSKYFLWDTAGGRLTPLADAVETEPCPILQSFEEYAGEWFEKESDFEFRGQAEAAKVIDAYVNDICAAFDFELVDSVDKSYSFSSKTYHSRAINYTGSKDVPKDQSMTFNGDVKCNICIWWTIEGNYLEVHPNYVSDGIIKTDLGLRYISNDGSESEELIPSRIPSSVIDHYDNKS